MDEEELEGEQVVEEKTTEKTNSELKSNLVIDETKVEDNDEKEEPVSFGCNKAYIRRTFLSLNIYWRTLFLFFAAFIYILIAGAIFTAVERPNELEQNQAMEQANATYYRALVRLVNILEANSNLTTENATALVEAVGTAAVSVSSISVTENWSYGSSVFFVTTVVTTIGYGSIAPVTTLGRGLFIPVAIFGIPLMLIFLTQLGLLLNKLFELVTKPLGKRMENQWIKITVLSIGGVIGLIAFVFIPAVIFSEVDGWTYFESIYFCFVSLTTVGFGDFVPSTPSNLQGLYRVCLSGWIFFGLAFIALVITRVQDYISQTGKRIKKCKNRVNKKMKNRKTTEKTSSVV